MSEAGGPGFGVYVHWPFCASKCPYCDFNSHVRHGGFDAGRYRKAYARELAHMASLQADEPVVSIFIGGGTPSLMPPSLVAGILEDIARLWRVAPGAEITLEANPSSVEAERFTGYRDAGVNRVSLGVQSLNDGDLRFLGRLHTVAEARKALDVARSTFGRTSFDLIYARPGQTLEAWTAELQDALAFAPSHLSLYQLTIEAGTPFAALAHAGRLQVPADEEAGELYAATQELTAAAGLPAYEISNHARPGEECRHNLVYWRYGTYAGVGPGAHGRLRAGRLRRATMAERSPERWLSLVETHGNGLAEDELLGVPEQADERLIMGLRLSEGLDLETLSSCTGLEPDERVVAGLVDAGLLTRHGSHIAATDHGRMVLNRIVLELSDALAASSRPQPEALASAHGSA